MTYILERHRGELQDERKQAEEIRANVLLPDHKTLDRYLTRFYGFMANGTYEGAALFELMPTWTRFLQSKGLTTEEEGQQALRSLQALSQSMLQLVAGSESDPLLVANMREWHNSAGI